uniref:Immunoglobulin V-set domain-containing protein n=1 Tax=Cyprinodon variegatus TaxID=28743 RepID=A0A3Q2DLV1_CYPVA
MFYQALILVSSNLLAPIKTSKTVWAPVGGQASLSFQLTEDKDVLQITWQKVLSNGKLNLANYTRIYGYRVRAGLEMIDFHCENLQSCSMVIRKVMEEDEGCYQCLFNTYPRGALIVRTCLRLYGEERRHAVEHRNICNGSFLHKCDFVYLFFLIPELHDPILDIRRSNVSAESVVSCSFIDSVTFFLFFSKDFNWIYVVVVVTLACSCCLAIFTYWRYKTYKNK